MRPVQERIFLVEKYFSSSGSFATCQAAFREKFPNSPVPGRSTISFLVRKFKETGSIFNRKRRQTYTALTKRKLAEVARVLEQSPQTSLTKLRQRCGLSYGSAHRATRKLKMRPYRFQVVHQLKEPDHVARVQYCRWFRRFVEEEGTQVFDKFFFSDEAWFHLDGQVNAQNSRTWSTFNPRLIRERPLHSEKIGVWCAISRKRVIGPLFYDQNVTAAVYQNLLLAFISLLEPDERQCWFQQDGAAAHTAHTTTAMLEEFFDDRFISRGLWPPRSPDLTPPDFFLWGMLKNKVYANNPRTIEDLKRNIENGIAEITVDTLNNVFRNMQRRVDACLEQQGGHFQHLL